MTIKAYEANGYRHDLDLLTGCLDLTTSGGERKLGTCTLHIFNSNVMQVERFVLACGTVSV